MSVSSFRGSIPIARALTAAWAALVLEASCSSSMRSEGLDPSTLPAEVRDDYAVFARRCSKCHSLARPLTAAISDDSYWSMYVTRMRRQPGSGISQEDTAPILRFLHYYSLEQRRQGPAAPASSSTTTSRSESKRTF